MLVPKGVPLGTLMTPNAPTARTQRALNGIFTIALWFALEASAVLMAATPVPSPGASFNYPAPMLKLYAPIARPAAAIGSLPGYVQFQMSVDDPDGRPIIQLKQADFVFPATPH